jgi:hypothetical protein
MPEVIKTFFTADPHLPVWCIWTISLTFLWAGICVGIMIGKSIQMKRDEIHFWWNRPSPPKALSWRTVEYLHTNRHKTRAKYWRARKRA